MYHNNNNKNNKKNFQQKKMRKIFFHTTKNKHAHAISKQIWTHIQRHCDVYILYCMKNKKQEQ